MNVQQTLILIILMMFGVSFAPRANAFDGYECRMSSSEYRARIGDIEDFRSEIKRNAYRFNNSDEGLQEKSNYVYRILHLLKWEIRSTSNRESRGTILYWLHEMKEYCGRLQSVRRQMGENRDRRSRLIKERAFWNKEKYRINGEIIQKEKEAKRNGN